MEGSYDFDGHASFWVLMPILLGRFIILHYLWLDFVINQTIYLNFLSQGSYQEIVRSFDHYFTIVSKLKNNYNFKYQGNWTTW